VQEVLQKWESEYFGCTEPGRLDKEYWEAHKKLEPSPGDEDENAGKLAIEEEGGAEFPEGL